MPTIKWKREYNQYLGVLTDEQVADKLNCPVMQVMVRRMELGRAKVSEPGRERRQRGRPKHVWTPEEIALLGTDYDRKIALRIGCSFGLVVSKRKELGISAYGTGGRSCRQFTPEEDALLGTMTDLKVAERIGSQWFDVRRRRLALGIRPYGQAERRGVFHTDEARRDLATMSPQQLMDKYQVSRQRIQQVRVKAGIAAPAYRDVHPLPDMIGQKVGIAGKSTVVGFNSDRTGYRVRCFCGREFDFVGYLYKRRSYKCKHCPAGLVRRRKPDPTGQKIPGTRLTAVRRVDERHNAKWLFDCDCGTKNFQALIANVQTLRTKTCGCGWRGPRAKREAA